jgi:hypothetical protein
MEKTGRINNASPVNLLAASSWNFQGSQIKND